MFSANQSTNNYNYKYNYSFMYQLYSCVVIYFFPNIKIPLIVIILAKQWKKQHEDF